LIDKNGHTALHIGTANDQTEIVRRLLHHPDIEVNPVSNKGLTPIIMATKRGKIQALEVFIYISVWTGIYPKLLQALLEDDRINPDEVDEEGYLLEELIGTGLPNKLGEHKISAGIKLFQEARKWRSIRDGDIFANPKA
jgi:hypothetical protein